MTFSRKPIKIQQSTWCILRNKQLPSNVTAFREFGRKKCYVTASQWIESSDVLLYWQKPIEFVWLFVLFLFFSLPLSPSCSLPLCFRSIYVDWVCKKMLNRFVCFKHLSSSEFPIVFHWVKTSPVCVRYKPIDHLFNMIYFHPHSTLSNVDEGWAYGMLHAPSKNAFD